MRSSCSLDKSGVLGHSPKNISTYLTFIPSTLLHTAINMRLTAILAVSLVSVTFAAPTPQLPEAISGVVGAAIKVPDQITGSLDPKPTVKHGTK
ncbi:hypothetical protein BDV59DRAFT_104323 [Aspergillus ambiguus]|uniref:uncharacterized protein n=1 Tax=Aspergillus ambiguus TaxID=176160 RepID=UPI003CCE4E0B